MGFKIGQWNFRSARSNNVFLKQLIMEEKFDIMLLGETWYKCNYNIKFNGFNILRKYRQDGKGGVAILIADKLCYQELHFNHTFNQKIEICGATVSVNNKKVSVVSLYRPPNAKVTSADYINVFNQIPHLMVVGGDFNAHHYIWGSSSSNPDGIILTDALEHFANLVVANTGAATRISPPGKNIFAVDLTLLTSELAESCSWEVAPDTYGSDHFPIRMKLFDDDPVELEKITPLSKWSTNDVDWLEYQLLINTSWKTPLPSYDTNEKITFFTNLVTDAANLTCKIKKPFLPTAKRAPLWWDDECLKLSQPRKSAFRLYQASSSLNNYVQYKNSDALCRRTFKHKARASWQQFCSSLNSQSNPSMVWNGVKKIRNSKKHTTVARQTAESMLDAIAPDYVAPAIPGINHIPTHFLNDLNSLEELDVCLKNSRNTAPGPDGINYTLLQNLPTVAKQFLCNNFHDIMTKSDNCSALKNAAVILIPKSNGTSARPIALMSCILKTLERIIKFRLEWWLENRKTFPPAQFGFRRGMGTQDCVAQLVTDIQLTFSNNEYMGALFLDIVSAYDNVDLNIPTLL